MDRLCKKHLPLDCSRSSTEAKECIFFSHPFGTVDQKRRLGFPFDSLEGCVPSSPTGRNPNGFGVICFYLFSALPASPSGPRPASPPGGERIAGPSMVSLSTVKQCRIHPFKVSDSNQPIHGPLFKSLGFPAHD
jgi:hypothetical protein